jgi:predicted transcriptional regulator
MKHKSKDILEMVKAGFTDKQIMKELGIQTKASLKKIYFDALVEGGKIKRKKQRKTKVVTIGKRGTLTLSRLLLMDTFKFKAGDKFKVSKRGSSINLKKT